MLHGRVVRPPEVGATVASVDEESVKHIAGFVKVVMRNNFVGVIAEKQWQAVQAARQLKVKWNPGAGLPEQKTFFESMRKQPSQDTLLVDSKDVEQRLAACARRGPRDVRLSLPDARIGRGIMRRGGREAGRSDRVVGDAVCLSHAKRRGKNSGTAA